MQTMKHVEQNLSYSGKWRLSRRDFLKSTAIATTVVGVGFGSLGGLAGCSPQNDDNQGSASGGSMAPVRFEPGTYTASADGKHGKVTVETVFSGEQIDKIQVTEHFESEDLTDIALKVIPQAIVYTQSLAVDAVSGATLTSLAVINAVGECARLAGADPDALKDRPAKVDTITQSMKPGTYTGESFGKYKTGDSTAVIFGGPADIEPTRVEVDVDESSIKAVRVLSTSDTPGFYEPAERIIVPRIVEQQSIYVDTCAGATLSATAITAATAKALESAGADLVGFARATQHDNSLTEDYECDLVIIGGGTTGTTAAMKAVEEGLSVVIMERTYRISGMGALATGPLGVESALHKQAGMNMTATELFSDMIKEADWKLNAPLVDTWLKGTGQMMDWLQERWEGIGDPGFSPPNEMMPFNYTCMYGKGTQKFQDLYDNYIIPGGATLLEGVRTTAISTKDGVITGATGINQATGATVNVKADAVFICTGGFGGNDAMLEATFGTSEFFLTGLSNNTGDGIKMCQELGCLLSDEIEPHISEFCGNATVDFFAGFMKYINQFGFLALDPAGNRFMNEEVFITAALESGGSALRRVGHCYIVFTQKDFDALAANGVMGILSEENFAALNMSPFLLMESPARLPQELENALAKGQAFKADTLDELCRAIGFDESDFTATMEEYSQVVAQKNDPIFGKSPFLLHPLETGPFLAVKVIPPIFGTYNGIKIDSRFRPLCGTEQKPTIAGLFVGGQDSGGVYSYPYTKWLGATSSYALTSGMLAISYIKEYLGR
jgi:fumarate reductase flavoprotein subunit